MEEYRISSGNPYPLGAQVLSDTSVNIAVVHKSDEPIGIVLYDTTTSGRFKIELDENNRIGNIYCIRIDDIDINRYEYTFYSGDVEYCDPYSKRVVGNERWGKTPAELRSAFVLNNDFRSKSDYKPLMTDYSDLVLYELHVRGFTKSKSSGVKNPGTFEGIVEKIPYLKNLGINAIELMPAYEFIELEAVKADVTAGNDVMNIMLEVEPKLNYWGYKEGYYFAPKASYASKGVDATQSFIEMVKALHSAGIEIIMQFYFPDKVKPAYILEVLKYWVHVYGVDGFHLMGEHMPLEILGTDPMLANTKLMYYGFPTYDIYGNDVPKYRNLAICNDDYMYTMRRFLKSDEGQLRGVLDAFKDYDTRLGHVHYITNCNGFTLMDLVSYDRKHNIDNGENDRDGNTYNASWNCGYEGPTTRKAIARLRRRQIRNAIVLNTLTQSTPLVLAGDEFGNSQKGNNNPYCLDNQITWLNWKDLDRNKDIYDFYKAMLALRSRYRMLHLNKAFVMSDYNNLGVPDLSWHGEEAWRIETDDLTRHFAALYNMNYAAEEIIQGKKKQEQNVGYIYIAVNMHWSPHTFALPKLPTGKKWEKIVDTSLEDSLETSIIEDSKKMLVKDRSIVVLISK